MARLSALFVSELRFSGSFRQSFLQSVVLGECKLRAQKALA
jgi:hypothetical protein